MSLNPKYEHRQIVRHSLSEKVNCFCGAKILIENRPEFDKITSFDEFNKYYWYRDELSQICKLLELEYRGTKQELNHIIEQYFKGNLIKK